VIDQEWVQLNLARVRAKTEYLRLLNHKLAWGATQGARSTRRIASSVKVYGSEFYIEAYRLLMEILGQHSVLTKGSPGALLEAGLERRCAARSSSPSGAARTRSSATSSPGSAWGCRGPRGSDTRHTRSRSPWTSP
jgi:alkylation response protein AidB-like acyl-CoA dehydrogenase